MRTPRINDRCRAAKAGFTLIEIMFSTVLVGIAMVSVTWAMSSASSSKAIVDEDTYTAAALAREIHELAMTLPGEPSGTVGATTVANVLALDSLVGASFSPPLRANLTVDNSMSGWTQDVNLEIYDMANLTTKTLDNPADGLPVGEPSIYKLIVVIKNGSQVIDTYSWWLTP